MGTAYDDAHEIEMLKAELIWTRQYYDNLNNHLWVKIGRFLRIVTVPEWKYNGCYRSENAESPLEDGD